MTPNHELLSYYATPGRMTDPGAHVDLLTGLPTDIAGLCQVVQGLLIHVFWAERYGRKLSEAEQATLNVRPAADKLALMRQTNPAALTTPRSLEQRQVGNCRDFSVLLCTFLRHQGTPARARCGFGTYFLPDHYEDHWVGEYWDAARQRWVMVDAQMDSFQQQALSLDFDPLDVPPERFIVAGCAYQMCRQGQADPDKFGIFDMHGLDFIQGNVVRDFLSLNKIEILPWDWGWGLLIEDKFRDRAVFDELSALLVAGDSSFERLRRMFDADPTLALVTEPAAAAG